MAEINPAVQRYVIAWSDRVEAEQKLRRAQDAMHAETTDVWRALARSRGPLLVELLDGSRWRVDTNGQKLWVEPERSMSPAALGDDGPAG